MHTIDKIYLQSLDRIQGGHEIFDLHSHRVIKIRKMIEITILRAIIKHIEEIGAHDKVTSLKFKNRAGFIYYIYWIAGVEYENKNKYYSEEYQEDEDYTDSKNCKNEDKYECLEAEEEIDEYELSYLEEYIQSNYYNIVNKENDAPIQEDQYEIKVPGMNEISDA